MKLHKTISMVLAAAMLAAPITASAQFGALGGMGKKMLGGGDGEVSGPDAATFLTGAMKSTKNVMISAALLAQALKDRGGLASQKEQIAAITGAQNFGELNGQKVQLEENLQTLTSRADLSADLNAAYQAGDAQQKKVIATAIANLALGIYRNVQLAGAAPGVMKGVGGNPQMLTRMGELKTAANLLGLQAKGLGTIGTALPKVMGALKIKALPQAETTDAMPVDI